MLKELNPHHDNVVFIPAKVSQARELSPPPVPRLRSNSRQVIIEAAEGRNSRQERNKENRIEVAGPLVPGYPPRLQTDLHTDLELEDITSLLKKAKVLREVISHSGK